MEPQNVLLVYMHVHVSSICYKSSEITLYQLRLTTFTSQSTKLMKTTFGVLITLSALLPLLTAQGVDLTLQRESSGSDVVRAAVNRIQAVLSFDRQLLRRIAFVESRDGTDTDTYRPEYHGGIWQVMKINF